MRLTLEEIKKRKARFDSKSAGFKKAAQDIGKLLKDGMSVEARRVFEAYARDHNFTRSDCIELSDLAALNELELRNSGRTGRAR